MALRLAAFSKLPPKEFSRFCTHSALSRGAPTATVLMRSLGTDGNFYGTTILGGAGTQCGGDPGCGTVFKVTPTGVLTTLYSFCSQPNCADGYDPSGLDFGLSGDALTLGTDGDFYGTTPFGALGLSPQGNYTAGTIFKITPQGDLTTLYTFTCNNSDQVPCPAGAWPSVPLLQGTDGNFYGATSAGGSDASCNYFSSDVGCGTVFQIMPNGTLTTLYAFCSQANCADGSGPSAGLVQATNGIFYGTTGGGGNTTASDCSYLNDGCGTVFSLNMGLRPFVQPVLSMGKVGAKIIILGNKLTGSTAVSFDGVAATFEVVSSTEITTTVPTGATTGYIKVTTPSGTLTSNAKFRVF
jgi:uncharacterized repeat protein (TIGR03803 family)